MNFKSYYDYDVYTDGRIWSNKSNRFLVPHKTRYVYLEVSLMINKKHISIYVHKLMGIVFLANFKNLPEIDHKDRNKLNNSLFNLHWVTKSENQHNTGIMSNNTSGVKGVSYEKKVDRWRGSLSINNERYVKRFKTKEEAISYRKELEVRFNIST